MVVRFPNGAGIGAHEHHCDSPEAYFVHAPGLVVVCPSTPSDAKGLLAAALEGEDPVIFLEPKVLYRAGREDVPTEHYTLPIGRARVRREGTDLTLVTYGGMVPVALEAAERSGASVEVIDLRTLFPWDRETVLDSVSRTGRLLLVQEPQGSAGVAAEIAAVVAEKALYDLQAPDRQSHWVRRSLAPVRHREARPDRCRPGACRHSGGSRTLTADRGGVRVVSDRHRLGGLDAMR